MAFPPAMDPKKWAQNKLGGPPSPPKPPGPPALGGAPPAFGHPAMPPHPAIPDAGPPLFNPALNSSTLPPDQAQWAQQGGKLPERPDNPPAVAKGDEATWEKAKAAVKKNWDAYDEPWAVTMHVFENMKNSK